MPFVICLLCSMEQTLSRYNKCIKSSGTPLVEKKQKVSSGWCTDLEGIPTWVQSLRHCHNKYFQAHKLHTFFPHCYFVYHFSLWLWQLGVYSRIYHRFTVSSAFICLFNLINILVILRLHTLYFLCTNQSCQ